MQAPVAEPIVETYRYLVEDRDFPTVREWKQATGNPVVGCFPVYTPVELIQAHGMLAAGVIGGGNQIELAHADSRFQSFVCSVIKSTLELGMTDRLDCFDGMVFSSICDPARNLASIYKRHFPKLQVEFIHFPQNPGSPSALTYLEAEYARLLASFSEISGRAVTDDDLAAAIAEWNRVRRLVRELYALRASSPERISAVDSYVLTRSTTILPPERSAALLQQALDEYRGLSVKPKDRVRILLIGAFCEQPPIDLIESLERAGCYLLDDDFLLGWRFFTDDVDCTNRPPLQALAESYLNHSVHASVKHDLRQKRAQGLIQRVQELQADAVIFLGAKFCEPALFDYALYRRALEEHGIRHLSLEFEEKMWLYDRIQSEVETFVESMLFD
jgi:benzoyl-CoA reductase subunit C